VYVPRLRSQALVLLLRTCPVSKGSSGKPAKVLPLGLYASLLRFDDTQQAAHFALRHKVRGAGTCVRARPCNCQEGCSACQVLQECEGLLPVKSMVAS
jgi:hypothetical protein